MLRLEPRIGVWSTNTTPESLGTELWTSELFPDPRYFMFWGMHFFTVWAAAYLTFGLGVRPSWRSYRLTVAVTAVWAVIVMVFNSLVGTNYGYLNAKPSAASALDLLGPWPWYVLNEIVIVAAFWALITWPWARRSRAERVSPRAGSAQRPAASRSSGR